MGKNNSQSETELSAEDEELLRQQAGEEEEGSAQVEDESDPDDDQEIDETQRLEEQRQEGEKRSKFVPHQALHEERERRKELEKNFTTLMERNARLEGRFQQMLDSMKREEEPEEQVPDRETQPFEYMAYQDRRLAKLEQMMNGQVQQTEHTSQLQAALNQGHTLASQYRAQVGPEDYDAAYEFVYNQRYQELKSMRYPDHQIPMILQREVQQGIIAALQNGVNPGEMLYNMAKYRGYQPKTTQKKQDIKADAQTRAKSLGGGAEKKLVTAGSVEDIARMSDEEFEAFIATKEGRKKFKNAFMGH